MRQGAQGWCTGMTLKDGMGREVGGGFMMGNTCTPMADLCQCMAKNHYNIENKNRKEKGKNNIQPNIPNFTYNNFTVMKIFLFGYIFNVSSNPRRPKLNPLNICHLLCCSLK